MAKSSVDQIRRRFDKDVERFSNLETGQVAMMDSALMLDLVTRAAAAVTPGAKDLLDIGCGAGNYTLKMLQRIGDLNCTLIDLSRPMLDRAVQRVTPATRGRVETIQADLREVDFGRQRFDVVICAATLHHLRTDEQWRDTFGRIHASLRPGGSFWIADMVLEDLPALQELMHARWGEYLAALGGGGPAGEAYRDGVFAYVEEEDTPKSLIEQIDLLRQAGFRRVDVLHKNTLFATFGGIRE